jgi:hypothetical protein
LLVPLVTHSLSPPRPHSLPGVSFSPSRQDVLPSTIFSLHFLVISCSASILPRLLNGLGAIYRISHTPSLCVC